MPLRQPKLLAGALDSLARVNSLSQPRTIFTQHQHLTKDHCFQDNFRKMVRGIAQPGPNNATARPILRSSHSAPLGRYVSLPLVATFPRSFHALTMRPLGGLVRWGCGPRGKQLRAILPAAYFPTPMSPRVMEPPGRF